MLTQEDKIWINNKVEQSLNEIERRMQQYFTGLYNHIDNINIITYENKISDLPNIPKKTRKKGKKEPKPKLDLSEFGF